MIVVTLMFLMLHYVLSSNISNFFFDKTINWGDSVPISRYRGNSVLCYTVNWCNSIWSSTHGSFCENERSRMFMALCQHGRIS